MDIHLLSHAKDDAGEEEEKPANTEDMSTPASTACPACSLGVLVHYM